MLNLITCAALFIITSDKRENLVVCNNGYTI